MKMVMIVYSQTADYDIMSAIRKLGIKGYTKMEKASGEGVETQPKLQTHTWPGENCVMFLAIEDSGLQSIEDMIRSLKKEHSRSGIKAFILPLEEII